jgi:3-hydroxyacyl-CoA dehydrogenase
VGLIPEMEAPCRDGKALNLELVRKERGIVCGNANASLLDLGNGILCAEFHTKMNTLDPGVLGMLRSGVGMVNEAAFGGLVVANQGPHFSAGANLRLLLREIDAANWAGVEALVRDFQDTAMALRFCRGPVVSAPHHCALGGAIELSQHAARVVCADEVTGGLVETAIGVIPAGGGTKEMLRRALADGPESGNPLPRLRRAFETIFLAKTGSSGNELAGLGYFRPDEVTCVPFGEQVDRAHAVCLDRIAAGYRPPAPAPLPAPGATAAETLRAIVAEFQAAGRASGHDAMIAGRLIHVLTGGSHPAGTPMTEQDILDLEREAFLSLCGTANTRARIAHMLDTGKPLRN